MLALSRLASSLLGLLFTVHLLLEAGGTRYALEATSVLEIAELEASQETVHRHQLVDLSMILGGPPEHRPGKAVVLDVNPTTAVRVRNVREVLDLAKAPHYPLPRRLLPILEPAVRGALLYGNELFFELDADAAAEGLHADPLHLIEQLPLAQAPERALVFRTQGQTVCVPLSFVSQVVPAGDGLCGVPHPGPLVGVVLHQQHLWPTYSLPGLIGGATIAEPLAVLVEVRGEGVGLLASEALGVRHRDQLNEMQVIDLERLFS